MPGRRALHLLVLVTLVGAAAALGTNRGSAATGAPTTAAVEPHVAMGAHLFVQFACSGCHGPQSRGGVSPYVPALTKVGKALTVAQLSSFI
jgi:mono/diheme cytochrome c family protein